MADKTKGVSTKNKGIHIPLKDRLPYAPQNLHMSKEKFVEEQKKRKEREEKVKEFNEKLKKEQESPVKQAEPQAEVNIPADEEKKRPGRPKKIE